MLETQTSPGYWFHWVARKDVIHRFLRMAILVGTLLAPINYTDQIVPLDLSTVDYLKMG